MVEKRTKRISAYLRFRRGLPSLHSKNIRDYFSESVLALTIRTYILGSIDRRHCEPSLIITYELLLS
jgi:hypothetical protein